MGLLVSGDGNNFHGDSDIYKIANPGLMCTMPTVGPSARIHPSRRVRLSTEGGIIGLYRFEFYDGDDEKEAYDLNPTPYNNLEDL